MKKTDEIYEQLDNIDEQIAKLEEQDLREDKLQKNELKRLRRAAERMPQEEEIAILEANRCSKKKLVKFAKTFTLCAFCLSISSLLMSIAGISGAKDLLDFTTIFNGKKKYFSLTMLALQVSMIIFSIMSYEIKSHHFKTYQKFRWIQILVLGVSISCNYLYLRRIMTDSYGIFALLLAVSTDLGAITLNELACVAKYRLYSTNSVENSDCTTFFEKLRIALFGRTIAKVNIKFNQMQELLKKSETSCDLSILGTKEKKEDFKVSHENINSAENFEDDAYDERAFG